VEEIVMGMTTVMADPVRVRVQVNGARRLIRRLDGQRRQWMRRPEGGELVATELAWRAGVAEGLRLAQQTLRQGA
jgi:hypothetical protein